MVLEKKAVAGTMESSDVMITIGPGEGLEVELESPVEKQYGAEIRRVILDTLRELGITDAKVSAIDKGALDCVVRARTETAACRASGETEYTWEGARR